MEYLSRLPTKACRRQAGQPTGTRCVVAAVPPLPPPAALDPPPPPSPKLAQPSQPSPAARRGNFTTASKLIKNCRLHVLKPRTRTQTAQITRETHDACPNAQTPKRPHARTHLPQWATNRQPSSITSPLGPTVCCTRPTPTLATAVAAANLSSQSTAMRWTVCASAS